MGFKYYENSFCCSNFYSDDLTSYDLAKSWLVIQTQWIFSQKFNCELINLVWNENASTQTTTFMDHYCDIIMGATASQITSLTIVYSTVYSDADQRKHQSSASLAFVQGIHRRPVNSPHKWPITRKMFPFDDVIMNNSSTVCIRLHSVRYDWWTYFLWHRLRCFTNTPVYRIAKYALIYIFDWVINIKAQHKLCIKPSMRWIVGGKLTDRITIISRHWNCADTCHPSRGPL